VIVIPALDIRDGECVPSVASAGAEERARWADPISAARYWAGCGFSRLHIRDVNADDGTADNVVLINSILRENIAAVQIAGGTPSNERIDELVANGAFNVVTALESSSQLGSLENAVQLWPDAIVVGITVRESRIVGTHRSELAAVSMIEDLSTTHLAGIIVTSAGRRGSMNGADVRLMSDVVRAIAVPVYAAGGVGSRRDLDDLADCGVAGAIIGTAFRAGALDARLIAEEYSEGR